MRRLRMLAWSLPSGGSTRPGRAVRMMTFSSSRVRSMWMSDTAAFGGGAVQAAVEVLTDLLVLDQELAVQRLGRVPPAAVGLGDTEAEAEGV